ncbi:MAG: carotenoid biosynthesis protein [Deltaproteobacteria bacterium]|nr:carotenoid biosynthesis protein [Deltaproteobacteria bacterium]
MITFLHRPYVFAFLFVFLILATLHIGLWRTLIWLIWGYFTALLSEASSIRNGFPYGIYHYIYDNLRGEILVFGVPIWDSASYAFIAYASFATAWFLVEPYFWVHVARRNLLSEQSEREGEAPMALPLEGATRAPIIDPHVSPSRPFAVATLGAFLMMLADMVIDPVANLGEKWFLGKIYFYPHGGEYFDVPLTNFAGWFLVAFVILTGFQLMEKFIFARMKLPVFGAKRFPFQALLGPAFYFGILGFNLTMTYWVETYSLFAVSAGICTGIFLLLMRKLKYRAR